MNKKIIIGLIVALVALIIVFFGMWIFRSTEKEGTIFSVTPKEETTIDSVMMVTDMGGLGDRSFNDSGWKGVQMVTKELGLKSDVIETKDQKNLVKNVEQAAQTSDVVIGLGFLMTDAIKEVSPKYSDTYFVLIDDNAKIESNVASYIFYAGQSGYLTGIISAGTTKSSKIGIVKGMEIPPVKTYIAGFKAGVKTWNEVTGENVKVDEKLVGDFVDTKKAKKLTKSLIKDGADIIWDVAGGAGLGMFEVVKEANRKAGITTEEARKGLERPKYFAVATDIDHDSMYPGEVLVSSLKKIPETVSMAIRDIYKGKFKGGTHNIDFKDNATGISTLPYTKQYVSKQAMNMVKKTKKLMKKRDQRLLIPLEFDDVDQYVEDFVVPEEFFKIPAE